MQRTAVGSIWAKYVKNGTYDIKQVPAFWRGEVEGRIQEDEKSEANDEGSGGIDENN